MNILKYLLILPLLFLANCARPPILTVCQGDLRVTLNLAMRSAVEIERRGQSEPGRGDLMAFTGLLPNGETVMVGPQFKYIDEEKVMATWGHEFMHLMCGAWHA